MFDLITNKIQLLRLNKKLEDFFCHNESFIPAVLPDYPKSIALSSVVAWHKWQDYDYRHYYAPPYSTTTGHGHKNRRYQLLRLHLEEFESFVTSEIIENWECEIQEVVGLAASKSILENFSSLDAMVEKNSKEMIYPICNERLQKNLKWYETRIFHENPKDYFKTFAWDNRIFLINTGGSHHFASARYLAKRLNKQKFLKSKLYRFTINEEAVYSLVNKFEMFVVSNNSTFTCKFIEIMRQFEIDYFFRYLPEPYRKDYCVLLLPRTNQFSMRIANIFKQMDIVDFGCFLFDLLRIQNVALHSH